LFYLFQVNLLSEGTPILPWRHTGLFLEYKAEVVGITVAGFIGNIRTTHITLQQKLFGSLDPDRSKVFNKCGTTTLAEYSTEMVWTHINVGCYGLQRNIGLMVRLFYMLLGLVYDGQVP
jgi:hypothetical protein